MQLGIYDFKAVETDGSTIKLHQQSVELGFSVGSAEPFEFLWFSNTRIAAGYVFGGGLPVWRVNFGFPF